MNQQTVRYRDSLRESSSNTLTTADALYRTVGEGFSIPAWDDVGTRPVFSKRDFQKGYVKPPPDPGAFSRVPKEIAGKIGYQYGNTTRLHLACLAGLLHYARLSTSKAEVPYVGGETISVPGGVFIVSILTIAEDIHARLFATEGRASYETKDGSISPSFKPFYDKVHHAAVKLEAWGYVRRVGFVDGSALNGTYWTFAGTALEDFAAGAPCETDDVLPATERVFSELDAARFNMGEACVSKYQRGRYLPHHAWNQAIAAEGSDQDRHVSIGSFERPEGTQVAIPYVVLEAEEGDIIDRYETTKSILETLYADGADLSQIPVAYSGNQSFHVRIPGGMFGAKVFQSIDVARRTIARWAETYVGEALDLNLFDPRHLVRMIGSTHERTGLRVTGFSGEEFMGLTLSEIVERAKKHEPFPLRDPLKVPRCEELVIQLQDAADSLFRFYVPAFEDVDERPSSGALKRALEGVAEGEAWHAKHLGRSKAAFVVACHMARESGDAWAQLTAWNAKNDPPLSERELRQCYRSAVRTISRTQNCANLQNV